MFQPLGPGGYPGRALLCLEESAGESVFPLVGEPSGWFGLVTDRATVGSRYRYRIDGGLRVPDPASQFQTRGCAWPQPDHRPAAVAVDRCRWRGRPWEEAAVYELHVSAFSPQGDFSAVTRRLDYLAKLGPPSS